MILSKERLLKEKQISGYRQEIIEKVIWLMEILNAIALCASDNETELC